MPARSIMRKHRWRMTILHLTKQDMTITNCFWMRTSSGSFFDGRNANEFTENKKHTEIRKETAPLKMKRGQKKLFALYAVMVLSICIGATCVYAAGDPLAVVNNLSTFIFSLIRAIGLILLGFGIVQVGLSLKSHDPSQRANGFLTLAGGIIITFAKEILDLIMG